MVIIVDLQPSWVTEPLCPLSSVACRLAHCQWQRSACPNLKHIRRAPTRGSLSTLNLGSLPAGRGHSDHDGNRGRGSVPVPRAGDSESGFGDGDGVPSVPAPGQLEIRDGGPRRPGPPGGKSTGTGTGDRGARALAASGRHETGIGTEGPQRATPHSAGRPRAAYNTGSARQRPEKSRFY